MRKRQRNGDDVGTRDDYLGDDMTEEILPESQDAAVLIETFTHRKAKRQNTTNEIIPPFPQLNNDVVLYLFSYFTYPKICDLRMISRGWKLFIEWACFRMLDSELQTFVEEGLLSFKKAMFINQVLGIPTEARVRKLGRLAIGISMLNEYSNWDVNMFFSQKYPIICAVGEYTKLACICMLPDDHREILINNPWGVRMLASKLITLEQCQQITNRDALRLLVSELGYRALTSGITSIGQYADYAGRNYTINELRSLLITELEPPEAFGVDRYQAVDDDNNHLQV